MEDKNKDKFWFPAMKYGVGWGFPVAWQGWAALLAYMALVISGSLFLTGSPGRFIFFPVYVIAVTVLLVFICWKKGERPKGSMKN